MEEKLLLVEQASAVGLFGTGNEVEDRYADVTSVVLIFVVAVRSAGVEPDKPISKHTINYCDVTLPRY